ncbi:MAG: HAMP domain-containing protein [Patescibacteria group bacterium]
MVWGLRTKFFLAFVGLVLVASAINLVVAVSAIQNSLTEDLLQRLVGNTKAQINDLTNFVLIGNKEGLINSIFNEKSSRKDLAYQLVLNENNQLLASTLVNQDPQQFVSYNVLPDGATEHIELVSLDDGQTVYDIALRLDYDKGIVRAGYFKNQIDASVLSIVYLLILGVVASIAVALAVSFLFTKSFFKPLAELKVAVEKVSAGDLSVRARVTTNDELGYLALAFNAMASEIQKSYQQLEGKVDERTSELNLKLDELGRLNRLMVGRELKMVELKQQNAHLLEQLTLKNNYHT